ncbi:unnamed protein product [Parnassius apollo]|uniref:(apollo) hypothetical protein n=1 Tax=Parnassius apollo TaxID=110799 RepID=A0A8S3X3K8_PARAO|nr:unnamed protein product [Parnassius apollo]
MKPVMTKSRSIHVLFCVMLFGFINKTQGNTVLTRMLNESNKNKNNLAKRQFTKENTNDTVYVIHRRTNCIQFGERPVICIEVVNDEKKHLEQPYEDFNDFKEISDFISKPNIKELLTGNINDTPFVDQTRLEKDLTNFRDVTRSRSNGFSEDYLDVNDLKLYRKLSTKNRGIGLPKKPRRLKIIVMNSKRHPKHERPESKYSRKLFELGNDKTLRSSEADNESSEETAKESSNENVDKMNEKGPKPKRFEVIENTEEWEEDAVISDESREDSTNEAFLKIPENISNKNKEKFLYAQSPTRHLSLNMSSDDRRRRLPHFLPKRYHWSKDDMRHLPYLWYNGPQGLHPGIYRKPY